MLTCSKIRFLSFLLLGLRPCVVSLVMWSSFVYMWGCRGTLCGCGGCCDCDACTVMHECQGMRLTAMLVWGMDEVWLWWVKGM